MRERYMLENPWDPSLLHKRKKRKPVESEDVNSPYLIELSYLNVRLARKGFMSIHKHDWIQILNFYDARIARRDELRILNGIGLLNKARI